MSDDTKRPGPIGPDDPSPALAGARSTPDDPDAPPSEEERVLSERLRDALADPSLPNPDADFARALALAHAPREIDPSEHKKIVAQAVLRAKPRGRVVQGVFGVATALALAAAAVLVVGRLDMQGKAASSAVSQATAPLVPVRSTQELFDEPFAKPLSRGAASARIDRIAMARAGDLRENRFAMWGVR
jgi:hypothetical protein